MRAVACISKPCIVSLNLHLSLSPFAIIIRFHFGSSARHDSFENLRFPLLYLFCQQEEDPLYVVPSLLKLNLELIEYSNSGQEPLAMKKEKKSAEKSADPVNNTNAFML